MVKERDPRHMREVRRELMLTTEVKDFIRGGVDDWKQGGKGLRRLPDGFYNIPPLYDGKTPIDEITERVKPGGCRLMVLGPGKGEDVGVAYEIIENRLGRPQDIERLQVDVFGLTQTITEEVKKIVRKDYSGTPEHPTPFEFYENPELVGAYDVVVAQESVGVNTNAHIRALMKSSRLLDVGGVAFIQCRMRKWKKTKGEVQEQMKRNFLWASKHSGQDYTIEFHDEPEPPKEEIPKVMRGDYSWAVIERRK
jgi:hypothetical protein